MSRTHKDRGKTYKCKCSYCVSIKKKMEFKHIDLKEIKEIKHSYNTKRITKKI